MMHSMVQYTLPVCFAPGRQPYRGLEMAQHGRMLTNIAQCTRPGLPSSQASRIAFHLPAEFASLGLAADLSVVRLYRFRLSAELARDGARASR